MLWSVVQSHKFKVNASPRACGFKNTIHAVHSLSHLLSDVLSCLSYSEVGF